MKKLLIFLLATLALSACEQPVVDENPNIPMPPNNEIWYTSSVNDVVIPNDANVFGANIISNTYNNGKGVITFDGEVTTIGSQAFYDHYRLTSVNIPDSVTAIGKRAFMCCTSLTSVTIGDSVTTIGNEAFSNCIDMTSVNIPDSVTEIGDEAFFECDSLTSVTIGNSVTTIGDHAFAYCDILKSVNIPDSVTAIGDSAFYACRSLTSVYCKATTPPSLGGTFVFGYNGSGFKIYVPAGSVKAYKSAEYWSEDAWRIVGYNF